MLFPLSDYEQNEDISDYLPPGWTEEKLRSHTTMDMSTLALDVSTYQYS